MRNRFRSKSKLVFASTLALFIVACSGGSPGNSALNLAGSWTLTTSSTQGHGNSSGTATLTQTGTGPGVNGTTTLTTTVGSITVTQSGTALTGTLTDSLNKTSFNFTGTLSGSNFTITGSTPCGGTSPQIASIAGTITASSAQGTYTIVRGTGCNSSGADAGTFTATKH